jgi:hypothetical protein
VGVPRYWGKPVGYLWISVRCQNWNLNLALPNPNLWEEKHQTRGAPRFCDLVRVPARGSTRRGGAGTLPVGWVVQGDSVGGDGDELFVVGEVWERAPARAGARHLVGGQNRRVPGPTEVSQHLLTRTLTGSDELGLTRTTI